MSQNLTPPALRYNSGKPQYSLLDMQALEPLVRVLEFWAKKYTRNNWKRDMNFDQLLDSMIRHIAALQKDQYDSESGIHHIGHILANAMFFSYHLQRSWVPLLNSQKSPEDSNSAKSRAERLWGSHSKSEKEWHSESHWSPTPTECGAVDMVNRLWTILEWVPSNIQNAPETSGSNFTTRPLRSVESEKSSIT